MYNREDTCFLLIIIIKNNKYSSVKFTRVHFRRTWMLREVNKTSVFHRTGCYFILIVFLKGVVGHESSIWGAEKPKRLATTGIVRLVWVAWWAESFSNNIFQIVLYCKRRCIVSQNFTSLSWMINIRICPWTTFIVFLVSHAP